MNDNDISEKFDDLMAVIIDNNIESYGRAKIENELNEILKIKPNDSVALYIYGCYYEKIKEYQKALECYEKIIQYETDKDKIEAAKESIEDCKELMKLQEEEDDNSQNCSDCEYSNSFYKLLGKLSPISLFAVKIIILVILILFFFKF